VAAFRAANLPDALQQRARTVPSEVRRETIQSIAASLGLPVVNGKVG
jgi:hypothetical protein